MASACVNNIAAMSPDNFPSATYQSYGWLSPPISFNRDDEQTSKQSGSSSTAADGPEVQDLPGVEDPVDFEFRPDDPVAMLPADELFSDGKLVPLRVASIKLSQSEAVNALTDIRSPERARPCRRIEMEISGTDPCLFSPKAPRCSSRWKEILGLKKLYQNPNPKSEPNNKTSSSNSNAKLLKHFLHRSSKSCSYSSSSTSSDHSLNIPLLKDSDCETVSISSSRLSLSSSSSGHDHEDLHRLSLDSDKPNPPLQSPNPFILNRNNPNQNPPPRMRMVKPKSSENNSTSRVGRSPLRRPAEDTSRGVSVDSPRMNSSGKIVFQSLERSSSSPSSFNGGPRYKNRAMERSYSANVRITPVLNVPVCSLSKSVSVFGFGQLFSSSPQKKDGSSNRGQMNCREMRR